VGGVSSRTRQRFTERRQDHSVYMGGWCGWCGWCCVCGGNGRERFEFATDDTPADILNACMCRQRLSGSLKQSATVASQDVLPHSCWTLPLSPLHLLGSFRPVRGLQLRVNGVGETVCLLEGFRECVGLVVIKRGLHLIADERQPLDEMRKRARVTRMLSAPLPSEYTGSIPIRIRASMQQGGTYQSLLRVR